ncbi:MAG: hypothetical protein HYY65_12450 [Candidatus Tectomicrobia bacterium]|uniref:Uncharacterized protein n=1 Tax=Tectimicrobiota bacterium TaxID=2528274 RepID=A0A932M1T3_UNCTE|nr:hypothetical protein [Candidatus Tectomicrobia bacterium]
MSTEDKVRLHPGYALQVADLMAPVEIAEDFTLGDLCRIIDHFEEMDRETFSALLQCPLEPFLEECLRPRDAGTEPGSDLHYIRLFWECEYDLRTETRWPPVTSLWLHVDGVGDIWEDHQPGGRFYEEGRDCSQCNRYAVEMTPLYALRHLPLRIDPVMTVRPSLTLESRHTPLDIPAPDVTLLQLIHALFWELSFFGTPEERDATRDELRQQVKRIDAGEERLIPLEEFRKKLDEETS